MTVGIDPRLRSAVIVLVALVWAANFTAPIFNTQYHPDPALNVAFMAVIGALTTLPTKRDKDE